MLAKASVWSEPTHLPKAETLEIVFSYEFDEEKAPGLAPSEAQSMVKIADGVLTVRHQGSACLTNAQPVQIPREDIGEIVIRVRSRKGKHMRLGWSKEERPEDRWQNKLDIPIMAAEEFHTYVINAKNALKRGVEPGARIRSIHLRPSDIDGDISEERCAESCTCCRVRRASSLWSFHGFPLPTSPFKDQMMEKHGIVFLNAVSQATKTRPSVPSLMTSLLPTATGVWDFADMLRDEYLTLAEILRSQGFSTASFIQNNNAGPQAGLHQGFSILLDNRSVSVKTEEVFGKRLESWLERNRDRNFFLYVHVMDPHGIYDPPPPFDQWYREIASVGTPVPFDRILDPEWV
jgi:hypothetical protein